MKKNLGSADRTIRVLLATVILLLAINSVLSGITEIIFVLVAGVLLLTGLIGYRPFYALFGLSSRKNEP